MGFSSWVHLEVERVVKDTGKAFLLLLEDGQELWVPRSQVADPDDYAEGDEGVELSVTEWFAKKEGLS